MDNKDLLIEQYIKQNEELTSLVKTLTESNAVLNETIKDLKETIKELQRQLNQNSGNSSKPPSSDGFRSPKPQSLRQKSDKKPGGQKGHTGSHMIVPHEPDEIMKHFPDKCLSCPHLTKCLESGKVFACKEKRYEVNALITTKVTEHQSISVNACPCKEEVLSGQFPKDIRSYVQYGNSVCVLAGLLSTYGAVSTMRIHTLLSGLLGVSLSTGTISSMVSRCSQRVGDILQTIKSMLVKEKVIHFDETGTDVNGKTIWVHNSSTASLTYQTINEKRGKDGMDDNGILPVYNGISVHDCWFSYWRYENITHAICCAHLLRELTGIIENYPEHEWAKCFKTLLRSMKKARDKAFAQGKQSLSRYYIQKFDKEYDRLMELAEKECPLPDDLPYKKKGRRKKGKERALIDRLKELKDAVCLFIKDFDVPFDNNQAERDVRNVKTKTKVSGCFRTKSGAQDYLNVMSYISTGRKHGVSAYDALSAAFDGNSKIVLQ